ncbi:MAG: DNA-methyltransferase [Nitrososphaerales archaeon]
MTVRPEATPRRARKNPYIPHLAAARFKPTEDWSIEQARSLYEARKLSQKYALDSVTYSDCITGMSSLPDESVDLIIADPPFGLDFSGKESIYNRDERYVRRGYREVNANYARFSKEWIMQLPRIMKESASAWIFSGWTNLGDILNAVKESSLTVTNHVIWKYQFGVFTKRKFVTSHYHLLFLTKSQDYYFNKITHYPLDIWEINRTYQKGKVKNGTKLPEELVQRCIEFTSRPGDLIFDPFMGNGTSAVAAKASFRHFLGFEANGSMRKVIESNLSMVKLGQSYTPYSTREDELVSRAKLRFSEKNIRVESQK